MARSAVRSDTTEGVRETDSEFMRGVSHKHDMICIKAKRYMIKQNHFFLVSLSRLIICTFSQLRRNILDWQYC